MHLQTHVLSGWCLADLLQLTPRERALAMLAAAAADLDGLGLLVSIDYYVEYHHVLGHNLLFGLILTAVLTFFSSHRLKAAALFLGLFHLHLVLDYYGSGPGWGIHYLWPFSAQEIQNRHAWAFASWQNFLTFAFFLGWTIFIVIRRSRTPLEALMPSLDEKIVAWFRSSQSRKAGPADPREL